MDGLSRPRSRRDFLRGLGVGGVAAVAGIASMSNPAMAAAMVADDVVIEGFRGQVDMVTIDPVITVSWSGLETTPESVTTNVTVSSSDLSGNETFVTKHTLSNWDQRRSHTVGVPTGLKDLTVSPWTDEDFRARQARGSVKTTPITISATATVNDRGGNPLASATVDATDFTVTVRSV